ncbi:MAG TPA: hypothetical protein PLQ13_09780 [Candidatus Krumholzibacteria bacterium]|nr:hypothetical protein [Candidatus Krumholzibacteria bacterium]
MMRRNVMMVLAILLLAAGMGVDRLWIQPTLAHTRALESQRKAAVAKVGSQAEAVAELAVLAEGLGLDDLSTLPAVFAGPDPIVFIGRLVRESGLQQVELMADEAEDAGTLRRARFTLRVQGAYAGFVQLVRALEQDVRLVTVDAIAIAEAPGGSLECRLVISIYEPQRKAAS